MENIQRSAGIDRTFISLITRPLISLRRVVHPQLSNFKSAVHEEIRLKKNTPTRWKIRNPTPGHKRTVKKKTNTKKNGKNKNQNKRGRLLENFSWLRAVWRRRKRPRWITYESSGSSKNHLGQSIPGNLFRPYDNDSAELRRAQHQKKTKKTKQTPSDGERKPNWKRNETKKNTTNNNNNKQTGNLEGVRRFVSYSSKSHRTEQIYRVLAALDDERTWALQKKTKKKRTRTASMKWTPIRSSQKKKIQHSKVRDQRWTFRFGLNELKKSFFFPKTGCGSSANQRKTPISVEYNQILDSCRAPDRSKSTILGECSRRNRAPWNPQQQKETTTTTKKNQRFPITRPLRVSFSLIII